MCSKRQAEQFKDLECVYIIDLFPTENYSPKQFHQAIKENTTSILLELPWKTEGESAVLNLWSHFWTSKPETTKQKHS